MASPVSDSLWERECKWMTTRRPLVFSLSQLSTDYGSAEAECMVDAFAEAFPNEQVREEYLSVLAWPGVGTRWKVFLEWLEKTDDQPKTAFEAFCRFARHLGRVTSYRCLALNNAQMNTILEKDTIWPSGRLRVQTDKEIDDVVNKHGVHLVAFARLYIGLRMIGDVDPSLSLHDEPETAVCIAGGYATFLGPKAQRRLPRLMGMNVPVVETLGYRVADLHRKGSSPWFKHRDVWFNGAEVECERYLLFEIPFYRERLQSFRTFETRDEVLNYLQLYQAKQAERKAKWDGVVYDGGLEDSHPLLLRMDAATAAREAEVARIQRRRAELAQQNKIKQQQRKAQLKSYAKETAKLRNKASAKVKRSFDDSKTKPN